MFLEPVRLVNQRELKVCIVTSDLPSFGQDRAQNFSPGIAAEWLAEARHGVSILSILPHELGNLKLKKYQSYYSNKSVRFIPLSYQGPPISSLLAAIQSYQVLYWMLENASSFDIVHFLDNEGLAYYTLLARHQGWAFQQLEICVGIYSPTLWNKHIRNESIEQVNDLAADFLERESVRLADRLVNMNDKVLDWMRKEGWQLSKRIVSISNSCDQCSGVRTAWLRLHDNIETKEFNLKVKEDLPLVSVCITHFNRPHYLAQALESIRNQDYSNFEVILVDDASTLPEANAYLDSLKEEFESKGWQIIRNKQNLFPGAARNLAARQSRGEYLLFMDDDNYAKSNEIRTFVQVARRVGADILTCAMDVFSGSAVPLQNTIFIHRFLPLGAAVGVGLYFNIFGDINALIKKQVYEKLNGLTEDYGIGGEDWELFSRAVLKGYHLEVIPLALFWYRDTPHSITKITHVHANYLRGIRAYLDAVPPELRANLVLSQMQQEKLHELLIEHNNLGKLLRSCWKLFSARAWRALRHPRRSVQKMTKYFIARRL